MFIHLTFLDKLNTLYDDENRFHICPVQLVIRTYIQTDDAFYKDIDFLL